MLHRAILGSLDRFMGVLIEQYAGKFPLWLAPVQAVVATVTQDGDDYAAEVAAALKAALEAIRKRGGGLVEAYPIVPDSSVHETRLPTGNHFGTVSMFRKQGFEVVAPLGSTNVLMRRTV